MHTSAWKNRIIWLKIFKLKILLIQLIAFQKGVMNLHSNQQYIGVILFHMFPPMMDRNWYFWLLIIKGLHLTCRWSWKTWKIIKKKVKYCILLLISENHHYLFGIVNLYSLFFLYIDDLDIQGKYILRHWQLCQIFNTYKTYFTHKTSICIDCNLLTESVF